MSDERILKDIAPLSGGWQRLQMRRDAQPREAGLLLPLATAAVLALVVILVRPQTRELQMPWSGARLVAQPSEGVGLQKVTGAEATALPSSDPRVHLYWLQGKGAP